MTNLEQPADDGYVFGGDAEHHLQRLFDACGALDRETEKQGAKARKR